MRISFSYYQCNFFDSLQQVRVVPSLVSRHLYLRPAGKNPVLLNSHTNCVFSHPRKQPAPVMDTFFGPQGCPLTRALTVLVYLLENGCFCVFFGIVQIHLLSAELKYRSQVTGYRAHEKYAVLHQSQVWTLFHTLFT